MQAVFNLFYNNPEKNIDFFFPLRRERLTGCISQKPRLVPLSTNTHSIFIPVLYVLKHMKPHFQNGEGDKQI